MFLRNKVVTLSLMASLCMAMSGSLWAASASWNSTSNGNWSDMANWNPNTTYPNGVGQIATFGSGGFTSTSETRVVTVDTPITVGTLTMQAVTTNKRYNITGAQVLTFDVASGSAVINSNLSGSARQILSVPIQIADPLTIDPFVFYSLDINSNMSGTILNPDVTITKVDSGTVAFAGNNNFGNGVVNIESGQLILSAASTGFNTTGGGVNSTLHINGGTLTLAGNSTGTNQYQSDVEAHGASVTLNSTRSDGGTTAVNEIGSLTVRSGSTLNANNSSGLGFSLAIATGEFLTVEDGATLNWTRTPTFSFSADLIIRNGATVRGDGTININNGGDGDEFRIQSGGKIAPGTSVGKLNIGAGSGLNTVTILEAGSILEMEIFGTTAGVTYDQLEIQGDLSISGSSLSLIDSGSGFQPEGDVYLWLINNTSIGSLTGQFAGLGNGDIATSIGVRNFSIYYGANFDTGELFGGNDIVLFSAGVPEPSTLGMLLLGLACMRRRRGREIWSKD